MRRFYVDKKLAIGQDVLLTGDEARHMLTVLRMGVGDELLLINGMGIELTARIETVTGDSSVELKILEETICAAEPSSAVTLFQCLPKAAKMETIIQKCVELGVFAIQPVYSKRCVVKPDSRDNKLLRYNKISQEAAKQSGRGIIPEVCAVLDIEKCDFEGYDLVLVAYEEVADSQAEDNSLKQVLRTNMGLWADANADRHAKIAIVIGPEGGFERKEVESILNSNKKAYSVSLGKRILRTETAGMAMLAMLMYEMEG